jgi:hypothetical protein
MLITRSFKALVLATVSGVTVSALAQNAPEPPPAAPAAQTSKGLNAGLEIGGGYDDNVYAIRNYEAADFYLTVRPFVRSKLGSGGTTLTLRGEGEIGRYADLTSEDYDDWTLGGDGRAARVEPPAKPPAARVTAAWKTSSAISAVSRKIRTVRAGPE